MRPVPTQPSVLCFTSKSGIGLPANVCTKPYGTRRRHVKGAEAPWVDARARAVQSFADSIGEVTRNGTAHLRNDGGRLGGARPLRSPPRGAAGADLVPARRVGAGRAPLLRHDEHP